MNKFVFAVLAAEALKPPRFAMGLTEEISRKELLLRTSYGMICWPKIGSPQITIGQGSKQSILVIRNKSKKTCVGNGNGGRGSGYSGEMDVGHNRRIDTQETQVVLQRPNRGAGLARGEDTAARWTLSGTGVPTGGRRAALLALTTRGGGRVDTDTGVGSGLHGTGVAAHGRRVRQRGGRKAGRMGGESAVARQIRDGYSDAGAERAQRSSVRTWCGHGEEGCADTEAFAGRRCGCGYRQWWWGAETVWPGSLGQEGRREDGRVGRAQHRGGCGTGRESSTEGVSNAATGGSGAGRGWS
ncbi:hypothetical protein DFH08DRAFT_1055138 [Mycena albidolilacea]|uniref:Uncharacterized protein n=1 Tax=Mycena albidolilacea TaxID=1033008 RepID=A0AAD7E9M4_9AGAR|nr:hypothetical protein DFH08DRAFT_1055138 [Mycena albidolilacea]